MSMFGMRVIGQRRVALRFEQFPEWARENLLEAVTDIQGRLYAATLAKIPRGKNGRLVAALDGGVENNATKVRGWVSLAGGDRKNVILPAVALEYGSNKGIGVAAKADRILYTVYGRYINPMRVAVPAYNRTTDIAAQMFMRGPLDAMSGEILDTLQGAMAKTVKQAEAA